MKEKWQRLDPCSIASIEHDTIDHVHDTMKSSRSTSLVIAIIACLAAWLVSTYADVDPKLVATVSAAVAVAAFFYSGRDYLLFQGGRKPRFVWMPKYRALCNPSRQILGAEHSERAMTLRLAAKGFTCDRQTPLALHFIRGHEKGDFSVELARINITVTLPITRETEVLVEAGWVAAFDTGDLWQLTREVKALIESDSDGDHESG